MPTYMHQWKYKDQQIRKMLDKVEEVDRAHVVRTAIEAFGGKLVGFYFCFGEYDGLSISLFADEASALACLMFLFGEGRLQSIHTTTLFDGDACTKSIRLAQKILKRTASAADGNA
ncbi:MAG: GYD domain-containing protein [Dokdonella sp.]